MNDPTPLITGVDFVCIPAQDFDAMTAFYGETLGLPFPTPHTLQVLGCVDSRVDPAQVLGLDLGEAVVMRNVGGRVISGLVYDTETGLIEVVVPPGTA